MYSIYLVYIHWSISQSFVQIIKKVYNHNENNNKISKTLTISAGKIVNVNVGRSWWGFVGWGD